MNMSKREDSRFSNEELIVVSENWQKIALEHNLKLKTIKNIVSTKSILAKAIDYKEKDELYWNLFSFELKIPYNAGIIFIKASESKFPHLSFSFAGKTSFEFCLWNEDFLDVISKYLGMYELQTGFTQFDKKYLIKTSDENKMKKLFDTKVINFMLDSDINLFKLENSKLELSGLINELELSKIKEFIDFSKNIIDQIE
jgi:hypothetical protein